MLSFFVLQIHRHSPYFCFLLFSLQTQTSNPFPHSVFISQMLNMPQAFYSVFFWLLFFFLLWVFYNLNLEWNLKSRGEGLYSSHFYFLRQQCEFNREICWATLAMKPFEIYSKKLHFSRNSSRMCKQNLITHKTLSFHIFPSYTSY